MARHIEGIISVDNTCIGGVRSIFPLVPSSFCRPEGATWEERFAKMAGPVSGERDYADEIRTRTERPPAANFDFGP